MKCSNCHNDIPNNAKFCKYCGAQQAETPAPSTPSQPKMIQNLSNTLPPYTSSISKFSGFDAAAPYESEMISPQVQPTFTLSKAVKLSTQTILKIQFGYWFLALLGLFQKQTNIRWFSLTQLFQNSFSWIVYLCAILIVALIAMDLLLIGGYSKNKSVLISYEIISLMISSLFTVLLIYYLPLTEIGNHFGVSITFWGFIISIGGLFNFSLGLNVLTRSAAQQNND